MRRKTSIIDLQPHTSKLLDSLCLQIAYTRADSDSLGLLEILNWRISDEIDETEFSQLYKQWLNSKGVFDLTKSKQSQSFDKMQLLQTQTQINLKKDSQISRILRILRKQYNLNFLTLYKHKSKMIQITDSLFSILDIEQCFHLRAPQIHILFSTLLLSKQYTLKPATLQNYWRIFHSFLKQINLVQNNKISIRGFKNYFISNTTIEEIQLVQKNLQNMKLSLGFYEDGIKVWKRYQKQLSGKHQLVCRRVFSQNQHLFLVEKINNQNILDDLSMKYGASFLALNNIDIKVIQQFSKVIDGIFKKLINDIFKSIDKQQSQASSHQTMTSKTKTIKIKKSVSAKKSLVKRQSIKTPTKSSHSFFTPRKQSTNMRNIIVSPLSKTRQSIEPISPSNNNILQSLRIFKNQRVQSFQSVMKRLKKR